MDSSNVHHRRCSLTFHLLDIQSSDQDKSCCNYKVTFNGKLNSYRQHLGVALWSNILSARHKFGTRIGRQWIGSTNSQGILNVNDF